MRADRDYFLDLALLQHLEILLGQLAEGQVVAYAARRVAGATFLPENAEGDAQVAHDLG
jgi:hypothetical protein